MLTCIDVKFIFDSVRLGLSSRANILQIADVALRVVFLLFLPCFLLLFHLVPAVVLTVETSEMSAIFFFHNQNNSTSPLGPLGNGALTCSGLHFWRHSLVKHNILPNLVVSNWLWWIMHELLANQNWGNILNEWYCIFKDHTQISLFSWQSTTVSPSQKLRT